MTNDTTASAPYHNFMTRWKVVQHEQLPELESRWDALTPKLERAWLANAFVAKTVLNLPTTVALIDRLMADRSLRRICSFPACKKLPSEATFSRAFAEFGETRLAERAHEALIKENLGETLIDHNPRKETKIEFAPAEAVRYNERTTAERNNARLKDEFGGRYVMVKGATKVISHLMFGVLVLSADQLMRLRQ